VEHVSICSEAGLVIQKAVEQQPDFILLDMTLSDRSGLDMLRDLKLDEQTKTIPVVIVSVVDEKSKGLSLGAADYLVKPVSLEQVRDSVDRIFAQTPPQKAMLVQTKPDRPNILLVEDNPINMTTIADFLQVKGFKVYTAVNGIEAVEQAILLKPDLILMDIQMPIMDGLEATRLIRDNTSVQHIPIIALTALAMSGDRERCFEAGVNEYLSKPIRLDQLQHVMRTLLSAPGTPGIRYNHPG
jgi:CheY-like chemotaxis protein